MIDNKKYLNFFEEKVIIPGVEKNILGKKGMITLKNCKLSNSPFGKFVGNVLECEQVLAIDYYGHIKKSKGLLDVVDKYHGIEVKSILVTVVYFASVKNDHILDLAQDLMDDFPLFKKHLIELRGFKTN